MPASVEEKSMLVSARDREWSCFFTRPAREAADDGGTPQDMTPCGFRYSIENRLVIRKTRKNKAKTVRILLIRKD
jgi:hypothetical protein